ncbi:MAG: hypothetical protein QM604_01645 [Microbacterium sp.]
MADSSFGHDRGFASSVRAEVAGDGWGRFPPGSPERHALRAIHELTGVAVRPLRLDLGDGCRVEVDGGAADGSVVAQLPFRGGEFTSAYRNKIMADMFKLGWLRRLAAPRARAVLCVSPSAAAAFRPGGWLVRAAADTAIDAFCWDGQTLAALSPPAG